MVLSDKHIIFASVNQNKYIMDYTKANDISSTIIKYLTANDADFNEVYPTELNGFPCLIVEVNWGDWKHSHGYLDYLMKQKDFFKIRENVTEENGSDCYSANHIYLIPTIENLISYRNFILGKDKK